MPFKLKIIILVFCLSIISPLCAEELDHEVFNTEIMTSYKTLEISQETHDGHNVTRKIIERITLQSVDEKKTSYNLESNTESYSWKTKAWTTAQSFADVTTILAGLIPLTTKVQTGELGLIVLESKNFTLIEGHLFPAKVGNKLQVAYTMYNTFDGKPPLGDECLLTQQHYASFEIFEKLSASTIHPELKGDAYKIELADVIHSKVSLNQDGNCEELKALEHVTYYFITELGTAIEKQRKYYDYKKNLKQTDSYKLISFEK